MATAITNNGTGIAGFLSDLNMNAEAVDNVGEPVESRKSTTESTESETVKPNEEPESHVLLLIDASSHLFTEEFVQRPTLPIGLRQIKERLHTSVRQYISKLDSDSTDPYRIVVRAYAALDKIPHGHLEGFFAGFSSADTNFDFTLLLSEAFVEERINDVFETAMSDQSCRHILFAAWGRPSYLSLLQPSVAKVTLVEGANMGAGVGVLLGPVPVTAFPNVFVSSHKIDSLRAMLRHVHPEGIPSTHLLSVINNKKQCVAGKCGQKHIQCEPGSPTNTAARGIENVKGRMTGCLPNSNKPGHVPLNKDGHRLDAALAYPEPSHFLEFASRFPRYGQQPCNWHHLGDGCFRGEECPYDHSEVSDSVYKFIRFKAKLIPCADGNQCRRSTCPFGHICQSKKCIGKDVANCQLRAFHQVDPLLAQWVRGSETQESAACGQTDIGWGSLV